jgi:hypothetical protein
LTSRAPSFGYEYSITTADLNSFFCSSSFQASYYDHQSYRGDDASLTSRAPSFGYYEYSITTADLTSFAPSFGYFFSFRNSFAHQVFRHRTTIIKVIAEMKRKNHAEMTISQNPSLFLFT